MDILRSWLDSLAQSHSRAEQHRPKQQARRNLETHSPRLVQSVLQPTQRSEEEDKSIGTNAISSFEGIGAVKRTASEALHDTAKPSAKRNKMEAESTLEIKHRSLDAQAGRETGPVPTPLKRPRDEDMIDSLRSKKRKTRVVPDEVPNTLPPCKDLQGSPPRSFHASKCWIPHDDPAEVQTGVPEMRPSIALRNKAEQYIRARQPQTSTATQWSTDQLVGVGSWSGSSRIPGSLRLGSKGDKIVLPIRKLRRGA